MEGEGEWIAWGSGGAGEGSEMLHVFDWRLYHAKSLEEVKEICKDLQTSKRRIIEGCEVPPILALVDNCQHPNHNGLDPEHFEEACEILIAAGFDIQSTIRKSSDGAGDAFLDAANLSTYGRCNLSFDWPPFINFLNKKGVTPNSEQITEYRASCCL